MRVLVVLEPDVKTLDLSGRSLLSAALKFSEQASVLVLGEDSEEIVNAAAVIRGVSEVYWAKDVSLKPILAESASACILSLMPSFDVVLAPASTFGKNILPRVAAKLDVVQISEVTKIISSDTFEHPIYAGNAIETIQVLDDKKVLTIRTTAFEPVKACQSACQITCITTSFPANRTIFERYMKSESKRPDLTQASCVVSGGRGLQNSENFKMIEALADVLGAAVGASRAAVDAGFVPNDYQVGQTGKIVAPSLYIAIGISGAIQHIAGMQESKVIVAINKDPDAPIFQVANYGLVGDLFEIVPKLITLLAALK